jgi:hypothetical protein
VVNFSLSRCSSSEFKLPMRPCPLIGQFKLHCSTTSDYSRRGNFLCHARQEESRLEKWENRFAKSFLNGQIGHPNWVSKVANDRKLPEIQEVRNKSNHFHFSKY